MTSFTRNGLDESGEVLGGSETGVITQNGALITTGSAIYVGGSYNSVVNDGTVFGGTRAIYVVGSRASITNSGLISSRGEVATIHAVIAITMIPPSADIINSGRILAAGPDTSGIVLEAGGNAIFNTGEILSTNGDGLRIQSLVYPGEFGNVIRNSGVISGGTLFSAILTDVDADTVINTGQILGRVALGGGADFYDGRGGMVIGPVLGGEGIDRLWGGALGEQMQGGGDDDVILGYGGDDLLMGEAGRDSLRGGDGDDVIDGGSEADTLRGDAGDDVIMSGEGDDLAYGGTGEDAVYGDTGNDTLYGGAGEDAVYGGSNDDLIYGGAEGDLLYGDGSSDTVYGGAGDDTVDGGGSADKVYGGAGDDTVDGGTNNDTVSGGFGNDVLLGNTGNDSLYGGWGRDTMTGGDGDDVFYFNTLPDGAADEITDFTVADDTIRLDDAAFAGLAAGALAAAAFVANTSGLATTAAHRVIYESDTGRLYFDEDGTGAAARVLFATLDAGLAMTSADVFVY